MRDTTNLLPAKHDWAPANRSLILEMRVRKGKGAIRGFADSALGVRSILVVKNHLGSCSKKRR